MKFLVLADLHRYKNNDMVQQDRIIHNMFSEIDFDAVIICGDIYETPEQRPPYADLHEVFCGRPVICVLGNHESFGRTPEATRAYYKKHYQPDKYNVHYLDIIGHYDFEDSAVRLYGNVLWYDGSTSVLKDQDLYNWGGWADKLIVDFDYMHEHELCLEQIIKHNNAPQYYTNILVTHTVPHYTLNEHRNKPFGMARFNAYSGVKDLLKGLGPTPDYSVCGHTHLRTVGKNIHGCRCFNVGSDYYNKIEYDIICT